MIPRSLTIALALALTLAAPASADPHLPFTPQPPVAINASYYTLADFDGDGRLDLGAVGTGKLGIALADGHGGFGTPDERLMWIGADLPITAFDVDGDGRADPILSAAGLFAFSYIGGVWQSASGAMVPAGAQLPWLQFAVDLDGDGRKEIAAGTYTGLWAQKIDPATGLNAPGTYTATGDIGPMAFADFNGDGKTDIAGLADFPTVNIGVKLLFGQGDLRFNLSGLAGGTGVDFQGIAAGDLNRDGHADVLTGDLGHGHANLVAYYGRGDGSFGAKQNLPIAFTGLVAPIVADLDGDGFAELVVPDDNRFTVYEHHGSGLVATWTYDAGQHIGRIKAEDYDSDGDVDLLLTMNGVVILRNDGAPDPRPDRESLRFGHDAGTRTLTVVNKGTAPLRNAAVSLDGDGDFAVIHETCSTTVVAPLATCDVDVRFTPSGAAVRSATLIVGSVRVPLAGTGFDAPAPPPGDDAPAAPVSGDDAAAAATPSATVSALTRTRFCGRRNLRFAYTLSAASPVTVTLQRLRSTKRLPAHCPARVAYRGAYTPLRTVTVDGTAGTNALSTATWNLKPGRYRLLVGGRRINFMVR